MIRVMPILIAVAIGILMYQFSAWRMKRELDARSTALRDRVLEPLVQRIAEAVGVPELKVHVYEVEPVNGLAAPDGRIFITRGFFQKYRGGEVSPEEMASVIAHELGHVALGHARRRMIDFSGQNAVRVTLAMILGRIIPFIGVYIADFIANLLGTGLSRRDEFEADAYAAAVLTKAGIGTGPQISLFRKLDRMAPAQGMPAWMMTHPKTEKRIEAIEKLRLSWSGADA